MAPPARLEHRLQTLRRGAEEVLLTGAVPRSHAECVDIGPWPVNPEPIRPEREDFGIHLRSTPEGSADEQLAPFGGGAMPRKKKSS